jgi:hypothetical protein
VFAQHPGGCGHDHQDRAAGLDCQERDHKRPTSDVEGVGDGGVHEQPDQHDGQQHPLGVGSSDVEQGGFEAGARPHAEHSDEQDQGLGGAAPAEVVQKMVGELGDREDEDQVEEQLQRRDCVPLDGLRRRGHRIWSAGAALTLPVMRPRAPGPPLGVRTGRGSPPSSRGA